SVRPPCRLRMKVRYSMRGEEKPLNNQRGSVAARPRPNNAASVPTVVANLNATVVDTDGEAVNRFVGGRREDRAGLDRKSGAVTRTYDRFAVEPTAAQRAAVVRADVLDRVVLARQIEHRDFD